MMIIEIEVYGDFDMAYTECLMISDTEYDTKSLLTEFSHSMNLKGHPETIFGGGLKIKKDGISGLTNKEYSGITNYWILFLEGKGFNKLKTKKVCFSD